MMDLLVRYNADKNKTDADGRNIMHIAALYSHLVTFRHSLEMGVDLGAKDNDGQTPVMIVVANRNDFKFAVLVTEGFVDLNRLLAEDPSMAPWVRGLKTYGRI
jgi:ankyrin repeat protein